MNQPLHPARYTAMAAEIRAGRVPDYALTALLEMDEAFAAWWSEQPEPPTPAAPATAMPLSKSEVA